MRWEHAFPAPGPGPRDRGTAPRPQDPASMKTFFLPYTLGRGPGAPRPWNVLPRRQKARIAKGLLPTVGPDAAGADADGSKIMKHIQSTPEREVADHVVPADGSVGGMLSKPLPYGWYSKRVSKKPLKEVRAAAGKKGGSVFAGGGVDAMTVRMRERWML